MSSLSKLVADSIDVPKPVRDVGLIPGIMCEHAADEIADSFRKKLKAIVLTGSVARGEASLIRKGDGWEFLGDVEFLIAFQDNAGLPSKPALDEIRQRIEDRLRRNNIQCAVDLSAVHPDYFRRLPPHVFSHELRECGQVVWGDGQILKTIPQFSAGEIAHEDAWRLLCNRMLELLECAAGISDGDEATDPKLRYRVLKLHLDMSTSLLVFLGKYAPGYRARLEIVRQLADREGAGEEYPFDMRGFADLLAACTSEKLGRAGAAAPLELSWRPAIRLAHKLWRWELEKLTAGRARGTDRQIFDAWMSMQPVGRRARGWLYVVRARGWHRSYREWARWLRLAGKGSPRYWTYLVASTLLFDAVEDDQASQQRPGRGDWASLDLLLPITSAAAATHAEISWRDVASDAALNYREFLVGTRA
jgi:hypothetical protein